MAFKITHSCIRCWACEPACPSQAITVHEKNSQFRIEANKCTECEGDYADPQCASICPVESAILNGLGVPVNPPGSLTGIPNKPFMEVEVQRHDR